MIALIGIAIALQGCNRTQPAVSSRVITIVAAENFWGNIAQAIGGRYVHAASIISNPNVDPHSYEPTAANARAFAGSTIAIVNGVGYDPWAVNLLAADTEPSVINVGDVLGLPKDANPHRWYNPSDVKVIVTHLVTMLSDERPSAKTYFARQAATFESTSLGKYHQLITEIRTQFSGVAVGASESIFAMIAPALHLDLVTPPRFLRTISEGGEVSPADVAVIEQQIATRKIWVYVVNSQNKTPEIQTQLALCRSHHIPIVSITETLQPATSSYATWQTSQLQHLYDALVAAKAQRRSP